LFPTIYHKTISCRAKYYHERFCYTKPSGSLNQGKGNKDRIVPMGTMLQRGIKAYIEAEKPRKYLFEGNNGEVYSQRGAQWAISQAVKKAGIVKEVKKGSSYPFHNRIYFIGIGV
jgi:integrase